MQGQPGRSKQNKEPDQQQRAYNKAPKIQKTHPTFIKVDKIEPGKHGYNTYVKILETDMTEENGVVIHNGYCGDETAKIKFQFAVNEETAKILKPDNVIAIRNGLSSVVNENQILKIDKFGKLTNEPNYKIEQVNQQVDKSKDKYELKKVKVNKDPEQVYHQRQYNQTRSNHNNNYQHGRQQDPQRQKNRY